MDPADPRRPIAPIPATPVLRGVAIRRTSSVEMDRPEGLDAIAIVRGRAREVVARGDAHVETATASLRLVTGSLEDPKIREIEATPAHPSLASLVGAGASAGFRGRLAGVLEEPVGSLLWRCCTEVPNLYVIGGFARQHARTPLGAKARLMVNQAGVCTGWRAGGTLMRGLHDEGMVPVVIGPPAPPVVRDDEPLGWHDEPPMAPLTVRRRRRLDLFAGGDRAQVWFRDTFQPADAAEMVIHEYTLDVALTADDPAGPTISSIDVTAHVLPWGDCPDAVASPQRMVGEALDHVAERARRELHGESTCTHLNACVGSLADLAAMHAAWRAAPGRA